MRADSVLLRLDLEDFRSLEYPEYLRYVEIIADKGMKYKAHKILSHPLWRKLREDNNDLYEQMYDLRELAEETN
jgi:hypothetical protein